MAFVGAILGVGRFVTWQGQRMDHEAGGWNCAGFKFEDMRLSRSLGLGILFMRAISSGRLELG
jgi:hypothetical protein